MDYRGIRPESDIDRQLTDEVRQILRQRHRQLDQRFPDTGLDTSSSYEDLIINYIRWLIRLCLSMIMGSE